MKTLHPTRLLFIVIFMAVSIAACQKEAAITTDSLYVPTDSDATASATLTDLQQGRSLYISNCASCHSLYLPESFTATRWKSIMPTMTPRTNLTSSEILLVTKYVSKGKL
jgi:hypothetical protein